MTSIRLSSSSSSSSSTLLFTWNRRIWNPKTAAITTTTTTTTTKRTTMKHQIEPRMILQKERRIGPHCPSYSFVTPSSSLWNQGGFVAFQSFHSSSKLQLNRFLFDSTEITREEEYVEYDENKKNNISSSNPNKNKNNKKKKCPVIILPRTDYRTIHAAKVLHLHNGDFIRAGIVTQEQIIIRNRHQRNHPRNEKKKNKDDAVTLPSSSSSNNSSSSYSGLITDHAIIQWLPEGKIKKDQPTTKDEPPGSLQITLKSLYLPQQRQQQQQQNVPPISLLLAIPRPLQLSRMMPILSQIGIHHLILTTASRVPKDYFGSHLFRPPMTKMKHLFIEGLCQSGDVHIPKVTIVHSSYGLKRFLNEDLDLMFPREEYARVIAHPYRHPSPFSFSSSYNDDNGMKRMRHVIFPSSSSSQQQQQRKEKKMILAIGPEGGWNENYELDLFENHHDFQRITLGSSVLRSDVATISLLTLAHDVCAND